MQAHHHEVKEPTSGNDTQNVILHDYVLHKSYCKINVNENVFKGYIQSKSIIYEVFVLKANASPLRSRDSPISAFFASSAANTGVSADANIVPIDSKAAATRHTQLYYYNFCKT